MKDPASITLSGVIRTANEFLKSYHPTLTLPIPIEDIVELKLNIRVILIQGLIRNFGVNAFITQAFDSIIVDEFMYTRQPERIRFTIAEEIGHLFLHKDWYKINGPKSIEEYLNFQQSIDGKLYSFIERQAKTFAGIVLMPETRMKERLSMFARKNNLPVPCSVYELPDAFPDFAQEFEVSVDSLLVRLNFLKLATVPDGFWSNVRRKL